VDRESGDSGGAVVESKSRKPARGERRSRNLETSASWMEWVVGREVLCFRTPPAFTLFDILFSEGEIRARKGLHSLSTPGHLSLPSRKGRRRPGRGGGAVATIASSPASSWSARFGTAADVVVVDVRLGPDTEGIPRILPPRPRFREGAAAATADRYLDLWLTVARVVVVAALSSVTFPCGKEKG
jgi:hypothetical protein